MSTSFLAFSLLALARAADEVPVSGEDAGAPATSPATDLAAAIDLSDDATGWLEQDLVLAAPQVPQAQGPKVIFMNYNGATLRAAPATPGAENSQTGASYHCSGNYPAFGGGPAQAAVHEIVVKALSPYNVQIVTERPTSGNYTMVMVGPTAGLGSGPLGCPSSYGRANVDCGDANPNNIPIVNHKAGGNGNQTIAATILQEVSHAYGLEHVGSPGEYLNAQVDDRTNRFGTECKPITAQPQFCASQHAKYCPGGGQNSDAELKGVVGAASPDTMPPTVAITSPAPGATFMPGASFQITVQATDDKSVASVQLTVNGMPQNTLTAAPYNFPVANIQEGSYVLGAIAKDSGGLTAMSAPVMITVGKGGGGTTVPSTTVGSATSATTAGSATTATTGATYTTATTIGQTGTSDCECHAASSPMSLGFTALGFVGLLGWRRRLSLPRA